METSTLNSAFILLFTLDPDLTEIVLLSLRVSGVALFFSSLIALPLGAVLALLSFPLSHTILIIMQSLTGLPPVLAGLFVYLVLSKQGLLGELSLLYTPYAMMMVQVIIMVPLLTVMTRQTISDLIYRHKEQWSVLGYRPMVMIGYFLYDARLSLMTSLLIALSRGLSEVGGVMIVGGNIHHATRVMTTAIALETSKGNLIFASSLGLVLLSLSMVITMTAFALRKRLLKSS
ncbi:MAG: ABC transporter permease [Alphaproteobacteria bacterium GM7ARS4]|nr:ABC transporter permease [Alphaproteobacteria bacterium GM7ARS4]